MPGTAPHQEPALDPVTFEVIRHRLLGITEEQAARLCSISGSKHVTEMSDYNVGLYLADGSVATMGRTILFHSSSMASMVRHIVADCAENPGINPGDMFIVNNPWKGSVHGPDMGLVAPYFADGELIFWSGAMMHMADIGGMRAGSMGLDATESFQEGLLMPPVKLVDGGVVRNDIWNLILSQTRTAAAMALDLKGLMAANHAASDGLDKLIAQYGATTLMAVMGRLIELSEERMRRSLRQLPDATIRAVGRLDRNTATGEIPMVAVQLRKEGDQLTFDYSESSAQVPDATNCTWGGLMAGLSAALLPTVAYDIPWNEGLYKPLTVVCPEGRICNASRPAAVSGNIAGAVWEVEIATLTAISKLLACSATYAAEAQAGPAGRPVALTFFGMNQHSERFTGRTYDVLASGGGGYSDHDGVNVQGHHNIERVRISNIEALELDFPVIYLSRGLAKRTAGAGRSRGGQSLSAVMVRHKGQTSVAPVAGAWDVPDSAGMFGGYPGPETTTYVVSGSNVRKLMAAGTVPAEHQVVGQTVAGAAAPRMRQLADDDVLVWQGTAGAGWGDPIERPVAELQHDLDSGAVSAVAAERVYGARLRDGSIDAEATQARRAEIRTERGGWAVTREGIPAQAGQLVTVAPLGDVLEYARDEAGAYFIRCGCGAAVAPATENWRDYAGVHVASDGFEDFGLRLDPALELRSYCCPSCSRLLSVDCCAVGEPHPHDVKVELSWLEARR
jgi:N-methylhydantoinase B